MSARDRLFALVRRLNNDLKKTRADRDRFKMLYAKSEEERTLLAEQVREHEEEKELIKDQHAHREFPLTRAVQRAD